VVAQRLRRLMSSSLPAFLARFAAADADDGGRPKNGRQKTTDGGAANHGEGRRRLHTGTLSQG